MCCRKCRSDSVKVGGNVEDVKVVLMRRGRNGVKMK